MKVNVMNECTHIDSRSTYYPLTRNSSFSLFSRCFSIEKRKGKKKRSVLFNFALKLRCFRLRAPFSYDFSGFLHKKKKKEKDTKRKKERGKKRYRSSNISGNEPTRDDGGKEGGILLPMR